MKNYTFCCLLLLLSNLLYGQDKLIVVNNKVSSLDGYEKIQFQLSLNNHIIQKGEKLNQQGSSFTIDQCKVYISSVSVLDSSFQEVFHSDEIFLIDFFKQNELFVNSKMIQNARQINFVIGTDTLISGMPPLSGDLSASTGMYWSWTNGVMCLKMEGVHSESSLKNENYVFHLGSPTISALPTVIWGNLSDKKLVFELKELFEQHSFGAFPSMMEESETATNLFYQFAQGFYVIH